VLLAGEFAYETDTKKLKIGNGIDVWNSLGYFSSGGATGATGATGSVGPTGANGLSPNTFYPVSGSPTIVNGTSSSTITVENGDEVGTVNPSIYTLENAGVVYTSAVPTYTTPMSVELGFLNTKVTVDGTTVTPSINKNDGTPVPYVAGKDLSIILNGPIATILYDKTVIQSGPHEQTLERVSINGKSAGLATITDAMV
jgi:hypothetical protein